MKKALFVAILGLFLIATPVFAQTITSTPTIEEQYISALTAVLTLLQQQVVTLEQQLADVQKTQVTQQAQTNTIATQVNQIAQNTAPSFGNTQPDPTPALVVQIPTSIQITQGANQTIELNGTAFAHFTVEVLDQNGNQINGVKVDINAQDNLYNNNGIPSDTEKTTPNNVFSYNTNIVGTKSITFTAGNLSTTTSLLVQSVADYQQAYLNSHTIINPTISNVVVATTTVLAGSTGDQLGSFVITQADEPVTINNIGYTTTSNLSGESNFILSTPPNRYSNGEITTTPKSENDVGSQINNFSPIKVQIDAPETPGTYTLTITSISLTGNVSGIARSITGLPLTFTYIVQ